MKTIKTKVNSSEISSELDLFEGKRLDPATKARIQSEVGQTLVDVILQSLDESKSPINNRSFRKLNPDYKSFKESQNLDGQPNLEFSGRMKDALEFRETSKGIKVGVFGDRAGVADGHNNFSGKSTLPRRAFLPKEGETFTKSARDTVREIIANSVVSDKGLSRADLSTITTKTQFRALLKERFPDLTFSETRSVILSNATLLNTLGEFDLIKWLT